MGKRVIVASLDMDFCGTPFKSMSQLLAVAEKITKLHTICMQCGSPASYSQLISKKSPEGNILVGGKEKYEARCRRCFKFPQE